MNLTSFLNKVDQTIEKYGREELLPNETVKSKDLLQNPYYN